MNIRLHCKSRRSGIAGLTDCVTVEELQPLRSSLAGQLLGASANCFQQLFELPLFAGRELVKNALQKRGVHLEQRNEHGLPLLGERDRAHAPIRLALHSADQSLFIQSIHGDAYRPWIEVHFRADRVDRQWALVEQDAEDSKIRVPQARLECGQKGNW